MRPLLAGLAALLPGLIGAAAAAAAATVGWIPIVGPLLAGIAITIATAGLLALEVALIGLLTSPGENLGQKLAEVCNLAARVGQGGIVRDLIGAVIQAIRPVRSGVVQKSFRMLTGQGPVAKSGQRIQSACGRSTAWSFASICPRVARTSSSSWTTCSRWSTNFWLNTPVGLALSLRFTRRTTAFLGMQQFDRNCLIEFIMLRGLDGNAAFLHRLHVIAERRNAIPHWGLIHDLDARKVHFHYGDNHRKWQRGLERILEAWWLCRDLQDSLLDRPRPRAGCRMRAATLAHRPDLPRSSGDRPVGGDEPHRRLMRPAPRKPMAQLSNEDEERYTWEGRPISRLAQVLLDLMIENLL